MGTLGVIFTDTCVLAEKYNCRRQEVIDVIDTFIRNGVYRGIDWQLVDVGGHDFDYIFKNVKNEVSWRDYCRALADNCVGMGWQTDCNTPLFIIGGDDVIPVPQVLFQMPENRLVPLQVDMFYGYPVDFNLREEMEKMSTKGYHRGDLFAYFMSKSVFNVSRLPLETGNIPATVQHDLGGYFQRSLDTGGTINIDSLLPTTAYSWYISMKKAVEGIPLLPLGQDNGCHLSDIYISPMLRMTDATAMAEYKQSLSKSDMLLFFLHGGDDPENTGFVGQGPRPNKRDDFDPPTGEYCKAFDIELLPYVKGNVLTTAACFGARYFSREYNYSRSQSMLLSALYDNNFLLYMGASHEAWLSMPVFSAQSDVRLTGFSMTLIKIYLNLVMRGEPAGLALMKAKWLYYDECKSEDSELADYTILEFNQFGDPTLAVRALSYNQVNGQHPIENTIRAHSEMIRSPKKEYTQLYSCKELSSLDEAYQDVRNCVDDGLAQLAHDLTMLLQGDNKLTRDNLFLTHILREIDADSYLFLYAQQSRFGDKYRTYVRADSSGNVKNIMQTI